MSNSCSTDEQRPVPPHFEEELRNKHFEYTYENGWTYEFWVPGHRRIVYAIHGGPMSGRRNYQTTYYQRVRKNLWQISWVEETNTIVSVVLDMDEKRITTFMSFSHGHWARNDEAKGYKRDEGKLDKWRELSLDQPETWKRTQIPEQATIDKIYEGRGSLEDIDMSWPTL
ncbi:phenolic acid decarboxylase [Rhodotorula diobovata]|uniref:Phenolic acid decarboxylase n=1 Tax=Rhodotorula diobovata TaxID=5288 RepID=A0A5C5G227_9BASI|nr:phenolic acid decarboxylase [Rhodotorula diobovata]